MKTLGIAFVTAALAIGQTATAFAAMPHPLAGGPLISAATRAGDGAALKCPDGEVPRWEQTPAPGHYYCAKPPTSGGNEFDRGYLPPF